MSDIDGQPAEPREHQTEPREYQIGLGPVFAGIFGILTCSTLFATIDVLSSAGSDHTQTTLRAVLLGLLGSWAGMAIGIAWACGFSFDATSDRLGFRFRWSDIPLGILTGVASQLVLVWLVYLPVKWISPATYSHVSDSAKQLTSVATGWGVLPFVLGVCVLGPIFEELFFRGVMLRALTQKWGPAAGVLISSIAFALIHFEKIETIALAVFALLLALITLRIRRLGLAIVAHMAFNSVSVFALLVLS